MYAAVLDAAMCHAYEFLLMAVCFVWALQALQAACPSMGVIHVLQLSSGRVFHAGGCSGVHNSAPACDSGLAIYEQQLEIMKQMEPPASVLRVPSLQFVCDAALLYCAAKRWFFGF